MNSNMRVVGTKEMAGLLGVSRRTLARRVDCGAVTPLNPRKKPADGKFRKTRGAQAYRFDVGAVLAEVRGAKGARL